MNRMLKKVSAVMLSLIMVLGTMGVYAYGEPICICDTKCTEGEVNNDCPVCGGEGGISLCLGKEKEKEAKCICETKCAEGEVNNDCPVCGGEKGDITACLGKEKEKTEPQCICDTKCTEGEVNNDCPVCGGEKGDISLCLGKEEEKEAKCICDTKCIEGEVNNDCPVCGGEKGDISACVGAAAMVIATPMNARGITATKPEKGDGTSTAPYEISSKEELYWFAGLVNGTLTDGNGTAIQADTDAWAVLTADITINDNVLDENGTLIDDGSGLEEWTPIGSYGNKGDKAYTGTFDGQNHTISGLYVNVVQSSGDAYAGLFGYNNGTIENVKIEDSNITATAKGYSAYVGGICGYNYGGEITNCSSAETVTATSEGSKAYGGGICGYNYGPITNCSSAGTVTAEGSSFAYGGGICGANYREITNCSRTGDVKAISTGRGVCVGGICGYNYGPITNCSSTGDVTATTTSDLSYAYGGGICGRNYETITNCSSAGDVTATSTSDSSYAYGGGICGQNNGTIKNCSSEGDVTATTTSDLTYAYGGGICGENCDNGTITNCSSAGDVTATSTSYYAYVGGICGENCDNGTIKNCYFLETDGLIGIGNDKETATAVLKKTNDEFASGEVAWLLDQGNTPHQWAQQIGAENFPRPMMETGDGKYAVVQVTVNFPCSTTKKYYTNINMAWESYPVNGGNTVYEFYEDEKYENRIDNRTKIYTQDTDIYAKPGTAITGITLDKEQIVLYTGRSDVLTANVQPTNASYKDYLSWTSSDPSVAQVDLNGKVTAVGRGTAVITAKAIDGSGLEAQCTVTVRKKSSSSSTPAKYNLRFDTNGGDTMSTIVKKVNTTIDLDEYVPTREGYKFVGWYADEDLTKPIDEITLTQSTTIYAKWEKIEEEEQEETTEQEETAVSFTDVRESDWFYKAVSYAVENSLMSGMGDGTFSPNTPLQREMFATVLWNLEGNPAPKDVAPFLDVTSDKYYAEAIAWANENGIVAGYGDTFGVGDSITREQFAVMLHNYAQYQGYDVSVGEDTNILSYADAFDISNYAYPAMQWACGAGIMGGNDDGTLNPKGSTTRAEAATMLMNFCENVK